MGSNLMSGATVLCAMFIAGSRAMEGDGLAVLLCLGICLQELRNYRVESAEGRS